jgi:ubiquinone/menaquinone biosynthesis C-methylase UbiE
MSEPTFLSSTRSSYDAVAADYADANRVSLKDRPVDRALLASFAELILAAGGSAVADVGCGPGHVTAHLRHLGLAPVGIDLSPEMIAHARRSYPELTFNEGSMTKLDLPDGSVDGILALYSIIHIPSARLPEVFAEFQRVLSPGGQVLLVFQVRDEPWQLTEWFDQAVTLEYDRLRAEEVTRLLADVGLTVNVRLLREPDGIHEKVARAYLMASKGAAELRQH